MEKTYKDIIKHYEKIIIEKDKIIDELKPKDGVMAYDTEHLATYLSD